MNRRKFIGTLIGGITGAAAVRTWPFRVYSFPSEIVSVRPEDIVGWRIYGQAIGNVRPILLQEFFIHIADRGPGDAV